MPELRPVSIGVDVGTYEVKAVAIDSHGQVVARVKVAHDLDVPYPGWAEHDVDTVWWGGLVTVIQTLLARPELQSCEPICLCCSGIGPAVVPVDEAGRALRPAILYGIDTRAQEQINRLQLRLGSEDILRRSGNSLSTQSAGPKIAWLADHEPDIHARAATFHTCQSFLVQRLTGTKVMDHLTASYFHPLYSLKALDWDLSGCEEIVRLDQLPELAWSNEVAGRLLSAASTATGLPAGIPVLVGSADAPVEALACGVESPDSVMMMYGSSGFLIAPTSRPEPGLGHYCAPGLVRGSWLVAAGTSTAGTATRWLIDLLGLRSEGPGSDLTDGRAFTDLIELALMSPKGSRGLLVLPHLSGERTPVNDPDARGAIEGISLSHGRPELARALLEGVAHSMAWALESLPAGTDFDTRRRVVATGGGTANPVWVQAMSDISGVTQEMFVSPGASYGDAILGARALGLISDKPVLDYLPAPILVEPDQAAAPAYRRDHRRFTDLYFALREVREHAHQ